MFYVLSYFVLVFFSPFRIAITSLGEERASLSAFRTFFRFALVWFCLFPLPLGVLEGLRFVIGTPWTFLLTFFLQVLQSLSMAVSKILNDCCAALVTNSLVDKNEYMTVINFLTLERHTNIQSSRKHAYIILTSLNPAFI